MPIKRSKVYKRVALSWMHTLVSMFVLFVIMAFLIAVSLRFGGHRIVMGILAAGGIAALITFLISEVIVTMLMRAYKPDHKEFPHFINGVKELCKKKGMIIRPRLYILQMSVPNACAFGWGFIGMAAIGITKGLYDLLEPEEMKAVVAHELAHIKCRDVGLMTLLVIITGSAEQLAKLFTKGKTSLGRGPFAFIIGWFFWLIAKVMIPMGRSAISQERELTADALGALYMGSPDALITALRKLEKSIDKKREPSVIEHLFISHPGMDERIENLKQLTEGGN
jgi:heat shock protein HtpX